jgi:hypothetical protein
MPGFNDPAVLAKAKATRARKKAEREANKPFEPQKPALEQPKPVVNDPVIDAKVAEQIAAVAESGMVTPDPTKPETIPPNLFSSFSRRLEVFGDRPGYYRCWINDDKGGTTIGNALRSGWTMVNRKDVQLNAAATPRNNDLGSHVRQYVGTDESGQPMNAYLMEIPNWLHDLHNFGPGSREDYHKSLEDQIRGGTLFQKAGDGRYSAANPPPGGTALPPVAVDTKFSR